MAVSLGLLNVRLTSHERGMWSLREAAWQKNFPTGFKRDVVIAAGRGGLRVVEVAVDIDVAEESGRLWVRRADRRGLVFPTPAASPWPSDPKSHRDLDEAYLTNRLIDAHTDHLAERDARRSGSGLVRNRSAG